MRAAFALRAAACNIGVVSVCRILADAKAAPAAAYALNGRLQRLLMPTSIAVFAAPMVLRVVPAGMAAVLPSIPTVLPAWRIRVAASQSQHGEQGTYCSDQFRLRSMVDFSDDWVPGLWRSCGTFPRLKATGMRIGVCRCAIIFDS
jgi:hypothetical protein